MKQLRYNYFNTAQEVVNFVNDPPYHMHMLNPNNPIEVVTIIQRDYGDFILWYYN